MSTTTITRTTCKYPGCGEPAAPAAGTGRPPEYCAGRGHTRVSAWRETPGGWPQMVVGIACSPSTDVLSPTRSLRTYLKGGVIQEPRSTPALWSVQRERLVSTSPKSTKVDVPGVFAVTICMSSQRD